MKNKELKELEHSFDVDLSDLYNKYPVPIGDICDKLGIDVLFEDTMDDDYHGCIQFKNGKYLITVNNNHTTHNNIFTIAHELGHYLKHQHKVTTHGFLDRKKTQYESHQYKEEREANNFAARLLMPKDKFTEVFVETNGDLQALQRLFRVSLEAIKYRALNLGLILPQ